MQTSYPISMQLYQDAKKLLKFISDSWCYNMLVIRDMLVIPSRSMAIFTPYTTLMSLAVGNRLYLLQNVFDHYEDYVSDSEYRNEYSYFIRCREYKCSDFMQFCDDCRKAVRLDRNVRKRQYRNERREVIRKMEAWAYEQKNG